MKVLNKLMACPLLTALDWEFAERCINYLEKENEVTGKIAIEHAKQLYKDGKGTIKLSLLTDEITNKRMICIRVLNEKETSYLKPVIREGVLLKMKKINPF